MYMTNNKTNELHWFVSNLSQIIFHLQSSNKHFAFQNLSVYLTWETVWKTKKPKIIAPTWNDEFKLPDGSYSVSDIQDYTEYICKTWNLNNNSFYSCLQEKT